jgi:hypothetical protein
MQGEKKLHFTLSHFHHVRTESMLPAYGHVQTYLRGPAIVSTHATKKWGPEPHASYLVCCVQHHGDEGAVSLSTNSSAEHYFSFFHGVVLV